MSFRINNLDGTPQKPSRAAVMGGRRRDSRQPEADGRLAIGTPATAVAAD
jgi:hypothetical protein